MISLNQAHQHICMLPSLQSVAVSLGKVLGLVCAEDVCAAVNCPSVDSSLKDGFAVVSADIADASLSNPVRLTVIGAVTAGENTDKFRVTSGTTVRIMTGAPLPQGTTSELASEFAQLEGKFVMIRADARAGRNILQRGSDITQGQMVLARGNILGPVHLGLLCFCVTILITCKKRLEVLSGRLTC